MRNLLAISLVGVGLVAAGCSKGPATAERHEPTEGSATISLEGVWRSVEDESAFRLLPEGKADFSYGGRILAADYTVSGDRLRIEVASELERRVENFIIQKDHLEAESSRDLYYKEDEFLKRWLSANFADLAAVCVPEPGKTFFIEDDERNLFKPEESTFGAAYLEALRKLLHDQVVLSSLKPVKGNLWVGDGFQCELRPETGSWPRVKKARRGIVAFHLGKYDVLSIKSIEQSTATQDVSMVTGTYTFHPTPLGDRLMALQKEQVRPEYKFKALVKIPRTIGDQHWLNAWDWGHLDKEGYETKNIK